MVVWKVTGYRIGPNGNRTAFFEKKADAAKALRENRERLKFLQGSHHNIAKDGGGPHEITVRNRSELVTALNDAMDYGANKDQQAM